MDNPGEPQLSSSDNRDHERQAQDGTFAPDNSMDESIATQGTLQASTEEANKLSELESLYRNIEAYDWKNDQVYQRALYNMSRSTALSPYELELRARCFYWARKTKTQVDFEGYKNWKITQDQASSTFTPPNIEPSINSPTAGQNQPVLADTTILSTQSEEPSNIEQTNADETPYPQNFQLVAEMILAGRGHLLPGIKEIPPIVLADKMTAPTAEVRKKPWESDNAESPAVKGGMFGDRRDVFIRQEY